MRVYVMALQAWEGREGPSFVPALCIVSVSSSPCASRDNRCVLLCWRGGLIISLCLSPL